MAEDAGVVNPVTLNPMGALVKFPVTSMVLVLTVMQEPTKSMKLLQESEPILRLLARVSLSLAGSLVLSVGLKLSWREEGSLYTAGVNMKVSD